MKLSHALSAVSFVCLPLLLTQALSAGTPLAGQPAGDTFEWPHWRGPARNGISLESAWSAKGKPEAQWTKEVGLGYSSVSIADGRLFTMGYDADVEVDVVWCLDVETGAELWSHAYPAAIMKHLHDGGTLSTPTIDGPRVFSANREGMVFCLEAASGEVVWEADLKDLAKAAFGTWGFSASPLVDGDTLLLNAGKLVALDKLTGKLKWSTKDYGHSYSTPAPFDLRGTPALALFNGDGLAVLERATGKERYFHEWKTRYDINAATPHVIGDSIFISSGLGRGCALLKMAKDEAGKEAFELLWEKKSMNNKMSGCVLLDGHLYGFDEAVLRCIDLQGESKWGQRGLGNGALSAADGKLIVMTDEGELIIAQANPKEYVELSRTKVIDTGKVFWTMPVLANGRIFCRGSQGTLVCRDHRAQ